MIEKLELVGGIGDYTYIPYRGLREDFTVDMNDWDVIFLEDYSNYCCLRGKEKDGGMYVQKLYVYLNTSLKIFSISFASSSDFCCEFCGEFTGLVDEHRTKPWLCRGVEKKEEAMDIICRYVYALRYRCARDAGSYACHQECGDIDFYEKLKKGDKK